MKPFINIDKIPYEQIVSSIKLGIFEWLHIAVALISENMEFLYCNKSFIKMYGLPDEVVGKRVDDYLLTDRNGMMESLRQHKVAVCLNQDRSDVYGISMSYPIYDSKHVYRGVFVETVPMTSGKDTLSELMDSMRTVELKTYSNTTSRRGEKAKHSGLYTFDSIIGRSHPMNELRRLGTRVAKCNEPILIWGESGTGKEIVAQAVHMASLRADGPFVCVNCAALPADLMESELFGYESGSFTGAKSGGMKGKFEEANNGTIFLDEIGEMPLAVQAKLLRVLESGEIQKIGHKGQLRSNFRLVAATNRNLLEMVQHGMFREDLYHRLNVFELNIPPLRERGDDIFLLIRFFIENSLGIERSLRITLANDLVSAIQRYDWHGNVRELKNIMTHALFLLGDEENILSLQHLPPRFQRHLNSAPRDRIIAPDAAPAAVTPPPAAVQPVPMDERKMLQEALVKYQYNKVLMAKELGISRSKLYRDLRKYKLLNDGK